MQRPGEGLRKQDDPSASGGVTYTFFRRQRCAFAAPNHQRVTFRSFAVIQAFRPYRDLPAAVHILCAGTLISRIGAFFGVFLTIYVSQELGYGVTFATQCIGFFGLGGIAASLLGGQLADSIGRRPVMLFSLIGGAAILSGIGFIEHRWLLVAALFSLSLVSQMFRPAAAAMVGDVVTSENRPHAYSLMYIAANLGFAIAPPLGGWLSGTFSFPFLFLADAVSTLVFALLVYCCLPETAHHTAADATQESLQTEPPISTGECLRQLWSDSRFLIFCAGTLLISLVFIQSVSTLPLYLMSLGLTRAEFGTLIGVNGFLIAVFQLPVTQWLNRFQRISVIMIGELLVGVGFGLTALAATRILILGTIIVWTTGEILMAAFKNALAADLAPPPARGRYMGLFSMSHAVGISIGPPCGGLVLEYCGPQVLWSSCLLISLLAVLLYATSFRQLAAVRPEPAR